jgi:hypothetical protein
VDVMLVLSVGVVKKANRSPLALDQDSKDNAVANELAPLRLSPDQNIGA